ncbi:helix-turn-helix domain-containing protein [Actinoplanes sp. LDG1-06]|uniref:Helix-turn-helix domain-containing protein n=1 Tax=Paractinoplanes ovalisporus TaxID=2810368 RepID=A0ABS2AX99_9ACTN|nr:helix-turn-helix transcriptional regulator [Actinoplanes ovalisporus]MBM2623794.1 helix-turn-helix domain-containing protein [Actinoplanes ovalisporus]
MGPSPPPSSARRLELADFLRTRRAALPPPEGDTSRRRTPGLRREEVAQRSGVGLSWYTWLEQARDVTPSDQVLLALSRALELSPSEREHLFLLAGVAPPGLAGGLDDETAALVEGLMPHPAFVLSPRFDVLAANRSARLVLGPVDNLLVWLFTDGTWDETAAGWQQTALANLLDFRTEFARHPDDPAFVSLVGELRSHAHFRTWWERHDVQVLEPSHKRIPHRELGELSLLTVQSRPSHAPWLRLRILVPADARTREALKPI